MSRNEQLLETIINGEKLEGFKPLSRNEQILFNCANKKGLEGLPAPLSRSEALLQGLSNMIKSGLGGNSSGGGTSLNIVYGETPPMDTSKIWLQCDKRDNIDIQTTLNCSITDIANLSTINYEDLDYSKSNNLAWYNSGGVHTTCYIGNNQLLIIGQDFARVFDLETGKYVYNKAIDMTEQYEDTAHTLSSTIITFSNCIYADGNAYFAGTQLFKLTLNSNNVQEVVYMSKLYKYNTVNRELVEIKKYGTSFIDNQKENGYKLIPFVFLDNNVLSFFTYEYSYRDTDGDGVKDTIDNTPLYYIESYNIKQNGLLEPNNDVIKDHYGGVPPSSTFKYINPASVKVGNYIYTFDGYDTSVILDLNTMEFLTNIKFSSFLKSRLGYEVNGAFPIYDGIRYIYIIGGREGTDYNGIIRYDLIKNEYENLDKKTRKVNHFAVLGNNRIWIFGGSYGYNNSYTRQDKIDYFDLVYPLSQDNITIVTESPLNKSKKLYLINTEDLKLNIDIASAYKMNENNIIEKVNIRYYEIIRGKTTVSSVTFNKNTIASNFDVILNAIFGTNDGSILAVIANENNDRANFIVTNAPIDTENPDAGYNILVACSHGDSMMAGIIDKDGNLSPGDGTFPCTWLEGDTLTIELGEGYSSDESLQTLIDLHICTVDEKTDITKFWNGINCLDYKDGE